MTTIGITLGDPAGIGPEVVSEAIKAINLPPDFQIKIFGDAAGHTPGCPTKASASAAFEALEAAAKAALAGEIQAVVTGPVAKHAMHDVGFAFPGQTEFFADRWGIGDYAMCLTGGSLTVALATAHIPLAEVATALRADEVVRIGRLLERFLQKRGIKNPRIAVAGLNPHAGENGDLGGEEISIVTPAVNQLKASASAATFTGPHSPDTVFHQAVAGVFDGVVCMYHDQGLIPLKLHAFDKGVNVTLGLPFPRTSPDHGTAFSIAGKGLARSESTIAAIKLAIELVS